MLITDTILTPGLARWLAQAHDDDVRPLRVEQVGPHVSVTRDDGTEPSELEQCHCLGLLAAHAVEPL